MSPTREWIGKSGQMMESCVGNEFPPGNSAWKGSRDTRVYSETFSRTPLSSFKTASGSLNVSCAALPYSRLRTFSPFARPRLEPRAIVKTFSRLLHVRYVNASSGSVLDVEGSTSSPPGRPLSLLRVLPRSFSPGSFVLLGRGGSDVAMDNSRACATASLLCLHESPLNLFFEESIKSTYGSSFRKSSARRTIRRFVRRNTIRVENGCTYLAVLQTSPNGDTN